MTKAQEDAIETVKRAALNLYGYPEKKEIKQFDVKEIGYIRPGRPSPLFLTIEVGYIGDEGTLQAIICRHRGNFVIGPKGAITSTEARNGKHGFKGKAAKYPLIYGFTTFGSGR